MSEIDRLGAAWVAAEIIHLFGEARGLPTSEMKMLRYRLAGAWVEYALASHKAGKPFGNSAVREALREDLGKRLRE